MLLLLLAIVNAQHVQHIVNVSHVSKCQISQVFELDYTFLDANNQTVKGFQVQDTFKFGLVLGPSADFNMIYALTCMKMDCASQTCPRITFTLSATGPAQPNVGITNYGGAVGIWTVYQNLLQFLVLYLQ